MKPDVAAPVAAPRIIDGHSHVSSTYCVPHEFFVGLAQNLNARYSALRQPLPLGRVLELVVNQHQDHYADGFVAEMDAAGIAQAVLLVPDFTHVMRSEATIAELAQRHFEICCRHPGRFAVFFGVDPRWGADGLALFERSLDDYGFRGLKLYPPCGYSPSDRALYPFYEICRARRLPVLLHTGPTVPTLPFVHGHPNEIAQAAFDFPDVDFILAHGGVNHVHDAALLCAYRPNVYLDIGGFVSALHADGWAAHLAALFRLGINHKIIFGTDWPVFKMQGGQKKVVTTLLAEPGPMSGLPRVERELVLAGTMARLLDPSAPGTPPPNHAAAPGVAA